MIETDLDLLWDALAGFLFFVFFIVVHTTSFGQPLFKESTIHHWHVPVSKITLHEGNFFLAPISENLFVTYVYHEFF